MTGGAIAARRSFRASAAGGGSGPRPPARAAVFCGQLSAQMAGAGANRGGRFMAMDGGRRRRSKGSGDCVFPGEFGSRDRT
jgi:hypothetical protein